MQVRMPAPSLEQVQFSLKKVLGCMGHKIEFRSQETEYERSTSNVQRSTLNEKTVVSFDVGCWKLNVQRSSFYLFAFLRMLRGSQRIIRSCNVSHPAMQELSSCDLIAGSIKQYWILWSSHRMTLQGQLNAF